LSTTLTPVCLQGDDGQYDEEGNQARTFEDDHEYLDSGDEENMDAMEVTDDDKVVFHILKHVHVLVN
jgi:hypothetical protein